MVGISQGRIFPFLRVDMRSYTYFQKNRTGLCLLIYMYYLFYLTVMHHRRSIKVLI